MKVRECNAMLPRTAFVVVCLVGTLFAVGHAEILVQPANVPTLSTVQLFQRTLPPQTVYMARTVSPTKATQRWSGGNQTTQAHMSHPFTTNIRSLLRAGDELYAVVLESNIWYSINVTTNDFVSIGHPSIVGTTPSTLFFDGVSQTALTGSSLAATDLVHGLGSGAWADPTPPQFGWVATAHNLVRLDVTTGAAVRYAGTGLPSCPMETPVTHKQVWLGTGVCLVGVGGAAFIQTAANGDGRIFFADSGVVHVIDTTLPVGTPNVEANIPDSAALGEAWHVDVAAIDGSSGGAVVETGLAGEYLYVIPGTLSTEAANKGTLLVYNYVTNTIVPWTPPGQPFTSIGGVHYVRAIAGGHAEDVLLVTGEAGTDAAWSIPVAALISAFTSATTATPTTTTPPTTTPMPMSSDALRVNFTGDDVRVSQFRGTDRAVLRAGGAGQQLFALDSLLVTPSLLVSLASDPVAIFSDAGANLAVVTVNDQYSAYTQAGVLASGPTAVSGPSLTTIPHASRWNALDDSDYTGTLLSSVVVASDAGIALADRATGAITSIILGGPSGCVNPSYQPAQGIVGSTLCVRDIIAPALLQTLSSRFVYFQVTGSHAVFRLDTTATAGTASVDIFDNYLSQFPPVPGGTLAPVAVPTPTAVAGLAFAGGRSGEVYFVRAAAAFGAAGAAPHELLVWNSRDVHSRWVDSLHIRSLMSPAFNPASLHSARLQNGNEVVVIGGTGSTSDFAAIPMSLLQAPILPLIDECAAGIATCSLTQECHDHPISWACVCAQGYHTNGFACEDDNECLGEGVGDLCTANSTCVNTPGSFICPCNAGFLANGPVCDDVDECANANVCPSFATCTNLVGSFECDCQAGFTGDPNVVCFPTTVNEIFDTNTVFGDSNAPTVLVGGTGGYVVTIDRTSTPVIHTPITFSVTNPTDVLMLDFQDVVVFPAAGLGVLFQVSGPVTTLIIRNLIITGGGVFVLIAGSATRVVFSGGVVLVPDADLVGVAGLDKIILHDNIIEVHAFIGAA
jgi:hypothetical protein